MRPPGTMLDLALILVVLAACGARTPPPAEPAEPAALAFDIPTSARAKLSPAMAKTWGAGHLQPGTYTPMSQPRTPGNAASVRALISCVSTEKVSR